MCKKNSTSIILILLVVISLAGCSTVKLKKTDKVFNFFECNEFLIGNNNQLISKDKVCNCIIQKVESMQWINEEICLLRKFPSNKEGLIKCNITSHRASIKIFRPFFEKIMTIKGKCYKEITGEQYPYK